MRFEGRGPHGRLELLGDAVKKRRRGVYALTRAIPLNDAVASYHPCGLITDKHTAAFLNKRPTVPKALGWERAVPSRVRQHPTRTDAVAWIVSSTYR
jgi:hypothetical protein